MAKQQTLNAEMNGLQTNVGDLQKSPGALDIVDNMDLLVDGKLATRNGINRNALSGLYQQYLKGPSTHNIPYRIFANEIWNSNGLLAHMGLTVPDRLTYLGDGLSTTAPVDLATPDGSDFLFPVYGVTGTSNIKSRLFSNNKNSFVVGSPAVLRIEQPDAGDVTGNGKVSYAGMPRAPGIAAKQQYSGSGLNELRPDTPGIGASTFWLQPNYAVGYRCTYLTQDKQGVWRESAPSGKYIIANSSDYSGFSSGVNAQPILRFQTPLMTNTNGTYWSTQSNAFQPLKIRVYRTYAVDLTVGLPNDEYYLAYEGTLTNAECSAYSGGQSNIGNGYTTIYDSTPEFGLGANAYFNSIEGGDVNTGLVMPSQGSIGLAAENDPPPACKDAAIFQNCAFYVNTTPKSSLTFSITAVGTSGSGLLKAGDQIAVKGPTNTVIFTAVSGSPSGVDYLEQFTIHDTNVPSAAWSVRRTCENFCAAINRSVVGVTATYVGDLSNPEAAGKIYLECQRNQDTQIQVYGISGGVPAMAEYLSPRPDPTTFILSQTKIANPNGIAVSKPNIPDAVPPANYTLIGGNNNQIMRVVATSDAIFFFCKFGIYTCKGTGPSNFVFQEFDPSFRLWAPEAVTVLNDVVYAFGVQGIARMTISTGVQFIDGAIKNYVREIQKSLNPYLPLNPKNNTWAMSSDFTNQVWFWYPKYISNSGVTYNSGALVFNTDTGLWTTYSGSFDPVYSPTVPNSYDDGVLRNSDKSVFLFSKPESLNNYSYLLTMQPDQLLGGTDQSIFSADELFFNGTVQWRATIPNANGLCHWSDFSFYTQPPNDTTPYRQFFTVDITSDLGKTTTATVTELTSDKGRIILNTQNGYATRQTVKITVPGVAKRTFNGFSFLYRPVSGLNTR